MNREVHVRFWESVGLKCPTPLTFLKAYASVAQARLGIGAWLAFYNDERKHQALDYQTPAEVYRGAGATCGHVDKARALTTSPQALLQQEKEDSNPDWKKVGLDRDSLAA